VRCIATSSNAPTRAAGATSFAIARETCRNACKSTPNSDADARPSNTGVMSGPLASGGVFLALRAATALQESSSSLFIRLSPADGYRPHAGCN
jgi:hypothetical protein